MTKRIITLAIVVLVITFSFGNADAFFTRPEKIEFQSRSTYSLPNILDGIENGPEVTVYGKLIIPKADGKVPAVVFVHGSGGPNSKRYPKWLRLFKKMKIAVLAIDCFKGRGVKSTVGNQASVTTGMMTTDAYMALKFLANHPKIDKDRIGIFGASKGGSTSLYAAWVPFRRTLVGGDLKFAFHIALYPWCSTWENLEFTQSPFLILIGEKDNWTPAPFCVDFVESLVNSGHPNVKIIVYPNAHHCFDAHYDLQTVKDAYNYSDCDYRIRENGESYEATSGTLITTPETAKEARTKCAKKGDVKIGVNYKAKKQSMKDVKSFLKASLGI